MYFLLAMDATLGIFVVPVISATLGNFCGACASHGCNPEQFLGARASHGCHPEQFLWC